MVWGWRKVTKRDQVNGWSWIPIQFYVKREIRTHPHLFLRCIGKVFLLNQVDESYLHSAYLHLVDKRKEQ